MINIKKTECPDVLKPELPDSAGQVETRDVIAFYSDVANHLSGYKKMGKRGARIEGSYSAYLEGSVRKLLKELFHGKCAYCESRITATNSGDIEHFRPKGAYRNDNAGTLTRPGYYWLAADWENLLFSCAFCNQTYTHEIRAEGDIREKILGKLNQFPLLSETYRLNHSHGQLYFSDRETYARALQLEESERLLLNPCIDVDIEKHFKYDDQGVILAGEQMTPLQVKRAHTSIEVYALQRLGLVQEREAKVIQIRAQIRRVENAVYNLNTYFDSSEEERTWFEGILRVEMKILHRFERPDQEYAGLARYMIRRYFEATGLG